VAEWGRLFAVAPNEAALVAFVMLNGVRHPARGQEACTECDSRNPSVGQILRVAQDDSCHGVCFVADTSRAAADALRMTEAAPGACFSQSLSEAFTVSGVMFCVA